MSNPPTSTTTQAPVIPSSPTATDRIFRAYPGSEIDDALLKQCANLFSNNYGIWGQLPADMKGPKPGNRIKMTPNVLRQKLLSSPENTVLVVCYQSDDQDARQLRPVGHAFATAWGYEGGRVGWVTQLVVSATERRNYIGTFLLQMLKTLPTFRGITAIGLVSSHPAACNALAKYTSSPIQSVDLSFCRQNAKAISEGSPVEYVRTMKLRGSLFEDNCTSGAVSCADTGFYVDHAEPLEALSAYKDRGQWLFGELPEGHEFLIILPV